tara:strand:+ start:458 stop:886 length:429 start_codon:yes stop_codon:yes gene_type:complete
MEKFLFFNDGDNDATTYPLSNMLSLTHEGDTSVEFRFKSSKPLSSRVVGTFAQPAYTIDNTGGDAVAIMAAQTAAVTAGAIAYDKVVLTITAGTLAEGLMRTLVSHLNSGPNSDGFITVCDDVNSIQLDSAIASCAITYGVA